MYYWSSTEGSDYASFAWYVDFDYGYTDSNSKDSTRDVRSVLAF